jgi:uncharacterized membrane protein
MIFGNPLYNYFTKNDLREIQNLIHNLEMTTSCELRISLKYKRGIHQKKMSLRNISMKEFISLGVNKTIYKIGILIFILFKEKKFDIVTDTGVNKKISSEFWKVLANELSVSFSKGEFKSGLISIIEKMGNKLSIEFPVENKINNELSDDIIIH